MFSSDRNEARPSLSASLLLERRHIFHQSLLSIVKWHHKVSICSLNLNFMCKSQLDVSQVQKFVPNPKRSTNLLLGTDWDPLIMWNWLCRPEKFWPCSRAESSCDLKSWPSWHQKKELCLEELTLFIKLFSSSWSVKALYMLPVWFHSHSLSYTGDSDDLYRVSPAHRQR